MRIVAGVLCIAVSACSFGMKRVDPNWDGSVEPECTDDPTLAIGDAIIAGISLGVGAAAADDANASNSSGAAGVAVAGLFVGLGFVVSAIVGESTYKSCKEAKAQWRIGGAIGRASVANSSDEQRAKRFAKEHPEVEVAVPAQPAPPPRGFYCASSPTNTKVGFCAREKSTCEQTRDLLMGAAPDLAVCTLVERAWCFNDRCAPTQDDCRSMLARSGSTDLDCAEAR